MNDYRIVIEGAYREDRREHEARAIFLMPNGAGVFWRQPYVLQDGKESERLAEDVKLAQHVVEQREQAIKEAAYNEGYMHGWAASVYRPKT